MSDIKLNADVDTVMNNWKSESDKTKNELILIYGKLQGLKQAKTFIEVLQESYTACLQCNGLNSDEECEKLIKEITVVDAETQTENEKDSTVKDDNEDLTGEGGDQSVTKEI